MIGHAQSSSGGSSGYDPTGETFVLEHAYNLVKRLAAGSFFSTYQALQSPFDRPVFLRLYHRINDVGLSESALKRIRAHLTAGADGQLVLDFGEVPAGVPFVVLRPPEGRRATDWWNSSRRDAASLASLGVAILEGLNSLTVAQRAEVILDRVYVIEETDCPLRTDLYCIGDLPTRAEVRTMSRLVQRDLVLGFPPECFLTQLAGKDGMERDAQADVFRVGAILYQLMVGDHPVFPQLVDVADSVANLINDLGPKPKPLKTGFESLDRAILDSLAVDPSQRPDLQAFRDLLEAYVDIGCSKSDAKDQLSTEQTGPERTRHGSWGRWLRLPLFLIVLVVAVGATYLWTNRPPITASILITSDPPGVTFQRIQPDHTPRVIGRTPLLLVDEPISTTIEIQPLYEDGQVGEVVRLTPDRLQLLDSCRTLHVRFDPGATISQE